MGNLNQFYVMGRVTKAPEVGVMPDSKPIVAIAIQPGTGGRAARGPAESLILEACGPQVDAAKALVVGQSVLLRGQLRQESRDGVSLLVARVQAIELLAGSEGRGPRSDDATSGRRRRRGRGRGRGRDREPRADGSPGSTAEEGGATPAEGGSDAEERAPSAASTLPPPAPIVPELAAPSPPPPESTPDMPF